jgi:NAD(P)-dependent dehydrogenase (short-subunit alcohol dehydrogenase family)
MKAAELFDLSGRVAIVTGASRGIGEAIARTLADNGAEVIVTSRKLESCEAVAASIRAGGGKARAHACHIGEMDSIKALFEWLGREVGRLDILVNNAATNPSFGSVLDTDPAAFAKTADVNFRGYWFMCQYGARLMAAGGGGSIVNIASVTAERPMDGIGAYGATKAAVVNLTQCFARECASIGVRVNAVLPGLVNTKMAAVLQTEPEVRAEALKTIPLRRIAEPGEIVGAVLYFASGASSYATGSTLRVDGGINA